MLERIVEYEILTAPIVETVEPFARAVNRKIKSGWQPFGPPFIILDTQWAQINQAMVKYANSAQEPVEGVLKFKSIGNE